MDENNYPANWTVKSLEDICQILDSKRIPINNSERNERITGKNEFDLYPYYGATGQVGLIDDFIFEGEYILVGEDGAPFLDPIKQKAFIVNGKFWVNNHAHILLAHTSNKFLCHYLNLFNYSDFVTGTTRLKLNQALLRKIPVPIPPLNEQKRIVAKIEELFSELDNGIASLKTAREQLKVYRQAVLKHAFEGKLTAKWREENADKLESPEQLLVRIQQEREARYQQQLKDWETAVKEWEANGKNGKKASKPKTFSTIDLLSSSELKDLPELPNRFIYTYLSNLGDLGRGKSKHRPRNDPRLFGGEYPFIQTSEVKSANRIINKYQQTYSDFGLAQSKLWPSGTLCITIAANIAETSFLGFDSCFPDSIVGFTANKSVIPEYVELFIKAVRVNIEAYAPATAQKNINLVTLENLVVPYCSINEQSKIINEVESIFSVIDNNEKEIESALTKAEILHQSILKKAFSGQLVPQDPSDEPASELLARIQAEKESVNTQKAKKTKKIHSSDGH